MSENVKNKSASMGLAIKAIKNTYPDTYISFFNRVMNPALVCSQKINTKRFNARDQKTAGHAIEAYDQQNKLLGTVFFRLRDYKNDELLKQSLLATPNDSHNKLDSILANKKSDSAKELYVNILTVKNSDQKTRHREFINGVRF